MSLEFQFTCPLANGVHARPASLLEEVARGFGAEIVVTNKRTGRAANAKSVLAIIGAEIRHNDDCLVSVSGPDAKEAATALSVFLRDKFPQYEDLIVPGTVMNGAIPGLPRGLLRTGATVQHGTPVIPGVGRGRIVQTRGLHIADSIPSDGATDPAAEMAKLDTALAALAGSYEERLKRRGSRLEIDLLKAHLSVARDPEFRLRLNEAIHANGRTAGGAIVDVEALFTSMLDSSGSLLLRERTPDIRDVCFQLLCEVYGTRPGINDRSLTEDSIVVAETLTPEQFLAFDRPFLKGLVLGHAGPMSHTVILARSFGIPTVTGLTDAMASELEGAEALIDGDLGVLVTELTDPARRYYTMEQRRLKARQAREQRFAAQAAVTTDGQRLEIAGNIGSAAEAAEAFALGAESIGLFRTELLFLDRQTPPGEDEQFEEYRQTLAAAGRRPVIVRTLDVGGDKPLAFLNSPSEHNPFLGSRAVRIYPEFEALFRTQVRALIRASAHGRLKVMIPMVTSLEEVRWTKQIIADEQKNCERQGIAFDRAMPIGAMIEVPAAAFLLDALGRELDFFSIGTNDLLQGFAAVDRANPRLAKLCDPLQPAFLRLLKKIVDDVHAAGKWIGLCGEMGAQIACLPVLAGLGLDEISAAPSALMPLKAELATWPAAVCRQLLERALACATAGEVRGLIKDYAEQRPVPLLDPEMVLVDSDSTSKEEAIKTLVDRLYVVSRTEQPRAVEEAVWQRELFYSTGIGHGFAIPHCKTGAVTANSIALLKLRAPVEWNSLDDLPVHTVILLAVREQDHAEQHMRIFSQLARKLMDDGFRDQLAGMNDAGTICAFLENTLSF